MAHCFALKAETLSATINQENCLHVFSLNKKKLPNLNFQKIMNVLNVSSIYLIYNKPHLFSETSDMCTITEIFQTEKCTIKPKLAMHK